MSLKVLCDIVSDDRPQGMRGYVDVICGDVLSLIESKVKFIDYRVSCEPWADLACSDIIKWWSEHNKVKHHRMEHYKKANLGNVLNAFSALYTINIHVLFQMKFKESSAWQYDFAQFLTKSSHLFKLVRLAGVPFAHIFFE